MANDLKLTKLKLALISATIVSGMGMVSAHAEDGNVSEKDMMYQAVSLYEKLTGNEVVVPHALLNDCGDEAMSKAALLGFTNIDEVSSISDAVAIRKQDALTIIYKTILSYDYSFQLDSNEIDEIMMDCYDNALVDENNRAAFAFMLKHGIIDSGIDTEPNKIITWSGCATLLDVTYDLFIQDTVFSMNGIPIKIGANIDSVTEAFGEPTRIDKSDYDFMWYVYNSDPSSFMMVGVKEDRICAFYSNSGAFAFGDLKSGDDYLMAYKYLEDTNFRILKTRDGRIDAIMYNPYVKSDVTLSNDSYLRSCELVDIINANRVKNGLDILNVDKDLYNTAVSMASQPKYHELARDTRVAHIMDDAQHEEGYDVFLIYDKMLDHDSECFNKNSRSIGIATYTDESFNIYASMLTSNTSSALTTEASDVSEVSPNTYVFETTAVAETPEEYVFEVSEGTAEEEVNVSPQTPIVLFPANEATVNAGEDVSISLEANTTNNYYVEVYSYEEDKYIATSYMEATNNTLTLSNELFTEGRDYKIGLSAVTDTETSDKIDFNLQYGVAPEGAISIVSPEIEYVTDDDFINLDWETELYSEVAIDIYNEDGELVLNEYVKDIKGVRVNDIDPGKYYIYVSALRRGSKDVIKSQANINIEIKLPEPVITEYILDDGELFYPIYEDKEMGLIYFYDEEIVEVPVAASNGTTVMTRKKKITEKQVKGVAYYESLLRQCDRVEYFIGSPILSLSENANTFTYEGSKPSIYSDVIGDAIVTEAEKHLGVPYVWGGTTPKGFDCSGLVQYVYNSLGIELPRVSQAQYLYGAPLGREDLMPGDLVFFEKNGDVHHVGIYAGDGMMLHAPYTGQVVSYQSIDEGQYKNEFCGGRRAY